MGWGANTALNAQVCFGHPRAVDWAIAQAELRKVAKVEHALHWVLLVVDRRDDALGDALMDLPPDPGCDISA